jgi:hypothetical protein
MNNIISEYQKWKQQGRELRTQARHAMETRFAELLTEAAQIAEEYRADFGGSLKPPAQITAFKYKAGAKPKGKKASKPKPVATKAAEIPIRLEQPAPQNDRKTAGLRKRLETAKKKLETARSAGSPTRDLEDRVYEIEDALRLAAQD